MTRGDVGIRAAGTGDAEAIARLASELGYPATPEQIRDRLASFRGTPMQAVFVAERDSVAVGWVEIARVAPLEAEPFAEIRGLVVTHAERSSGIGTGLVMKAEEWGREHGLGRLRVRTNVVRTKAHRFYERLGFALTKTQKVFDKSLATPI